MINWTLEEGTKALRCLLLTSAEICKDGDDLDSQELDDLKDTWCAIKDILKIKRMVKDPAYGAMAFAHKHHDDEPEPMLHDGLTGLARKEMTVHKPMAS